MRKQLVLFILNLSHQKEQAWLLDQQHPSEGLIWGGIGHGEVKAFETWKGFTHLPVQQLSNWVTMEPSGFQKGSAGAPEVMTFELDNSPAAWRAHAQLSAVLYVDVLPNHLILKSY